MLKGRFKDAISRVFLWIVIAAFVTPLASLIHPVNASFPGTNGSIVFVSRPSGTYDIYTMAADGTNVVQLTSAVGNDLKPVWSADGTKIVFYTIRDGNYEIYSMSADGSNQTRLTNNSSTDFDPTWSADGNKIYFVSNRDGNYEIYSTNIDGSNQTNITNNSAVDQDPSVSPSGTKIAFRTYRDGNGEIYTMNTDGTGLIRLTNNSAIDQQPDWSPDGTKIAFRTDRDGGNNEIYTMNADGSSLVNITQDASNEFDPAWSPDGTLFIFATSRHVNNEIYKMNADGSAQTRLTNHVYDSGQPNWRPIPIIAAATNPTTQGAVVTNTTATPTCSDVTPTNSPDLFQIDRTGADATLHFTPVGGSNNYYFIAYGLSVFDERYSVSFSSENSGGAITCPIHDLDPLTTYYFKIRGGNGCQPGNWSNVLQVTRASNTSFFRVVK